MNYIEAQKRSEKLNKHVTAYDFEWNKRVMIHHDDGSFMNFNYAFYMTEDGWHFVFTEHNGYHCFSADEVHIYTYDMDL